VTNIDKKERFRTLAESRVTKAIKLIELIGNLSDTKNYEYSEAEVKKIFSFLEKTLDSSKSRFIEKLNKKKTKEFKL
jgi:hypothetical protein